MLRREPGTALRPKEAPLDPSNTIVFVRHVKGFTGGHLKAHDYAEHTRAAGISTVLWFVRGSVWDAGNPWRRDDLAPAELPAEPRALFVGGRDWLNIPPLYRGQDIPIINLIQHIRHADPSDSRYRFLSRHAIRVCVSEEVAQAVRDTSTGRGPVIAIPNGLDIAAIRRAAQETRTTDLVVVATKQPVAGRRIVESIGDAGTVELIIAPLPRADFLAALARSRVALFLPNALEGFYLPALEAMALGTLVVCPDCVGNRSFCVQGETAFRPAYTDEAIVAATREALVLPSVDAGVMTSRAGAMAEAHDIAVERTRFHDVLRDLDGLWRS